MIRSMSNVSKSLVQDCLYNWLGYGNPNGKYWFFGFEESEYPRSWFENAETLEDELRLRSEFDLVTDFQHTWEDVFGKPLDSFSRSFTWNYQAAFLLGAEDEPVSSHKTKKFVFQDAKLGRSNGNNLSAELLPLPKSDVNGTGPYSHIWSSSQEYMRDVIPGRIDLITSTLEANQNVEWVVVYGQNNRTAQLLRSEYENKEKESWQGLEHSRPFTRYNLFTGGNRTINLIHAPFFGQGRTSYENVADAARFFHDI